MSPRVVMGFENPADGAALIQVVPLSISTCPLVPAVTLEIPLPLELEIKALLAVKLVTPVPPAATLTVPQHGAADDPVKLPNALFAAALDCGKFSV